MSLYSALNEYQRTTAQPANVASVAVIGHIMERARHFHAEGHSEPFGIVEAIHAEAEADDNAALRDFLYSAEASVCGLVSRVMNDADTDAKASPLVWRCSEEIPPTIRLQTARQVLRDQMEARGGWAV